MKSGLVRKLSLCYLSQHESEVVVVLVLSACEVHAIKCCSDIRRTRLNPTYRCEEGLSDTLPVLRNMYLNDHGRFESNCLDLEPCLYLWTTAT